MGAVLGARHPLRASLLAEERAVHCQARCAPPVAGPERDGVAAVAAEPRCGHPVTGVDATRLRCQARREAPRVRQLPGPRVGLDDRGSSPSRRRSEPGRNTCTGEALAVPSALTAVTRTRSVWSRSAATTRYVLAVAPGIPTQLSPAAAQRSHWCRYAVGLLAQLPFSARRTRSVDLRSAPWRLLRSPGRTAYGWRTSRVDPDVDVDGCRGACPGTQEAPCCNM